MILQELIHGWANHGRTVEKKNLKSSKSTVPFYRIFWRINSKCTLDRFNVFFHDIFSYFFLKKRNTVKLTVNVVVVSHPMGPHLVFWSGVTLSVFMC